MKSLTNFAALLVCMAMPLLFISCGNEEAATEPEVATADTTTAPAAAVSTIVTTPQLMALIKHKVKDYAAWKTLFDSDDSARLASGLHTYVVGRGMDDSMTVVIAMKVDDLDKAKAFAKDPRLKTVMQKGGVVSAPEVSFVNVVWQDTANVGAIPRVITTYTVKDWDAWKKVYEETKQVRVDNGIVVRQYGHDADDNKKVSTVTALTDVAKAKAHWTSDVIKKTIADAGITSELNRFVFNIVQRY
jgi:hypothetical protein